MRQTWISSPDQGGDIKGCRSPVFLIVCCSPLSSTPSYPHPLITHHKPHTTHDTGTKVDSAVNPTTRPTGAITSAR